MTGTRSVWVPVGTMLLIQTMISMGNIAVPVLAPVINQELGIGPNLVGLYTGLMYAGAMTTLLLSGLLIARFGAGLVSQICLLTIAAGLALGSAGPAVTVILCAAVIGLAVGPETPASTQFIVGAVPPERRTFMFSLKQTGKPLGAMGAGLIIPLLSEAVGWRGVLVVFAAATVAVAALVDPVRRRYDVPATLPGGNGNALARLTAGARTAFSIPGVARLCLMNMTFTAGQTCAYVFLVVGLVDRMGYSLALAGTMLAVMQVTGIVGRLAWGWAASRWITPHTTLVICAAGFVLMPVLLGLATPEWPLAAIIAIVSGIGLTMNSWNGIMIGEVVRRAPPDQAGAVMSGAMIYAVVIAVASPLLFGWCAGMFGIGPCFVVLGLASSLGLWVLFWR